MTGWYTATGSSLAAIPVDQTRLHLANRADGGLDVTAHFSRTSREVASFGRGTWTATTEQVTTMRRERPGWATALGVLGLLFFLIGVVFFFVKVDVPETRNVTTVRLANGNSFTVQSVTATRGAATLPVPNVNVNVNR